jgi:probable HAF family extracellular repeat protein
MGSTQQKPRRRPSSHPRLEFLEDRCVPSTYAITDLGTHITPVAVNNYGVVIGDIINSSGQGVGFIYENGTLSVLHGRTSDFTFAGGLNDSNQVVGADSQGPVLWDNGTLTALPIAGVIANNGTIAGGYFPGEVDVDGTVTVLPVPGGGNFSLADAISNNGQFVAGFGPDVHYGSGESAPYLWDLSTGQAGTDLGGDPLGQAFGVNNSGQVVGFVAGDYGGSAFLSSNGRLTDLGQGIGSTANAINNNGVVVGVGSSGAFVYNNGLATRLQSLLPADSGFTLTNAVSINDNGQILCTARDTGGAEHGVLLDPVATPTLSLSGFPTTATAGEAHDLTVTVLNPDGSVATDYTGTVHFASSDPRAVLPADYTFTADDAGVHTFSVTLRTATGVNNYNYTPTVTVVDIASPGISGGQVEDAVDPGQATHFAVFGGVQSGRRFSVVVEALDSSGNVATGYTGTIHYTDSVSGQDLPADYTFTANNFGWHATSVTFTTPGRHTITVSDTLDSTIFGTEMIDVS